MIRDCTFNITTECDSVLNIECYRQSNCTDGAIRLVNRTSRLDGRFEVCVDGFWGVLPGPPPFDLLTAITPDFIPAEEICRQLEFPWEWALPYRISGDYPQLVSCGSANEHCYQPSCSRGSAYGVICQGNSSKPKECEHLDVRLVDGSTETEGRLEICAHGYWSNVCVEMVNEFHGVIEYWNRYAATLVCRKLGFPTEVALRNLHGAPFGSSPMLPVVRVDCGFDAQAITGDKPQAPPDTINDCRIINQSYACSRERTIIGISCEEERELYNITVEVLPAQESYEIGTEVTLRCVLPPSLQRFPSVIVSWSTLVPDVLPFPDDDNSSTPNISFVIPANHPASANYNCFVRGTHLRGNDVLLAMEGTTIEIKGLAPDVHGLCSVVVWYNPEVTCEGISGYNVRIYINQSVHWNVTRRVGGNGTFYIIRDEDILAGRTDETYVQVRIIHNGREREWSKGVSLGCKKPTVPEKPRVYFTLDGKIYRNNSAIPLTETGEGDNALHCKTDKEECCGMLPNRFGEFYYPNGVRVPIARQKHGFYRNRGDQIIRLNRREGTTSPTGTYQCEIPNADDEIVKIYIILTGN